MDKSSAAPKPTPPSVKGGDKPDTLEQTAYQRNLFMVMVLNMTWQLAIVVILPLVGGYELDQHHGTSPLWLIIGAVVAILGVVVVLQRVVSEANRRVAQGPAPKKDEEKS